MPVMADAQTPLRARACDLCKSSKIKCDASIGSPPSCSNCLKRGTSCTFIVPLKKRGPRTRSRASRGASASCAQLGSDGTFDGLNHSLETDVESPSRSRNQPPTPHVNLLASGFPVSDQHRKASWDATRYDSWTTSPTSGSLATIGSAPSIWLNLQRTLLDSSDERSPEAIMHECIDLYLRHLFPTTPLIQDKAIRRTITLVFNDDQKHLFGSSLQGSSTAHTPAISLSMPSPAHLVHESSDSSLGQGLGGWTFVRAVSLVCAVCAFVTLVVPEQPLGAGKSLAGAAAFLKTSRDLLSLCHDQDIQYPEASSITIRYFNSLCIHAAGNARVSWYTLGEAVRLAQEMRLYDETSLAGLEPAEAQLRRAVYWQLYTGDRSAAMLNNRPFSLHPLLLDTPMTLRLLDDGDANLLDNSLPQNTSEHVQVLNQGFNLSSMLFEAASTVILDLRTLKDFSKRTSPGSADLVRGQKAAITSSLIAFRCVLDGMPERIHRPWQMNAEEVPTVVQYQQGCYWVQHVNLKITFHCLRMIILQTAADYGFTSLLGLSDDGRLLAMEQTEIARDVLMCIQSAPFLALQLNGESCVEKIRQVGAVLLRLSQDPENPTVAQRARAEFQVLLDLLARLDSKASDSLTQEASVEWY